MITLGLGGTALAIRALPHIASLLTILRPVRGQR